ncbi:uncharacterized protein [Physcomitrium patens]|uniref:uncharacterized protein isoform X1 n=1 Tax=Physcomitrium patens TaxID=3218 RepID=UPI003CCE00CF
MRFSVVPRNLRCHRGCAEDDVELGGPSMWHLAACQRCVPPTWRTKAVHSGRGPDAAGSPCKPSIPSPTPAIQTSSHSSALELIHPPVLEPILLFIHSSVYTSIQACMRACSSCAGCVVGRGAGRIGAADRRSLPHWLPFPCRPTPS